ncbi:MAG TPA: hypothetical protein DEQ34_03710 [Balneolaceae bacterium]|nr:hypothetical protein [Balneolaceae bacterium]|tara:strand:- start:138032 stop:139807 length:1776 start_codon:yes stop_codon:yes gene_type:complete
MFEIYEFLQRAGIQSADTFWFPLLVWSIVAGLFFLSIRLFKRLNPLYHYHLRAATIAAIPFGLMIYMGMEQLRELWASIDQFDTAIFVVESPYTMMVSANSTTNEASLNWLEPNFLIGAATLSILSIGVIFILRLLIGYLKLHRFRNTLSRHPLSQQHFFADKNYENVSLAFQPEPMVPFTFGWRHPVIVLPENLKNDPEKTRMAIQHELIHIKRRDYALQLFLSVIESLFWFHPLIHLGSREIETWREISCDQEVLNTSGISQKNYAAMLFELLPQHRGLSSFSVSMAVQKSTLHKRIETMQYHKLYQNSVKRSLVLLFAMIIGITIPMACSDLQISDGLSEEEIINTSVTFNNPVLLINSLEVAKLPTMEPYKMPLSNGISIGAKNHGTIIFSGTEFEGARKLAYLNGDKINFQTNGLKFEFVNESDFIDSGEITIWAAHFPNRFSAGTRVTYLNASSLRDNSFLDKIGPEFRADTFTDESGDFFVVVEEMPELIGGLKSVQSKVLYPEMALRAGIEGRVTVQFIVNENGEVENPKIVRGIGGGCDEAALAAVSEAKFKPGIQRGKPVRVQYSLPVLFKLNDSDFTSQN